MKVFKNGYYLENVTYWQKLHIHLLWERHKYRCYMTTLERKRDISFKKLDKILYLSDYKGERDITLCHVEKKTAHEDAVSKPYNWWVNHLQLPEKIKWKNNTKLDEQIKNLSNG